MKHSITIPDFILEKLKQSKFNKLVEEVLSYYSDWVARNDTIFFREYTDHGVDHISKVLETSVSLMTEESKIQFSDADSCLLVMSTVLHDVALHVQEEQFVKLVEEKSYCNTIKGLDNITWHDLWVKFCAEACRFNQSQLHLLFNAKNVIPIPDLKKIESWTPSQYQLIGEFLRRHHARLAHDFAVFGFPTFNADGEVVYTKLQSDDFPKLIDLGGLVARSHGQDLRSLFCYLENEFGNLRVQEGTRAIYIMVLLRIADYLQLQSERAPRRQMIVKKLKSPLSRQEWGIHSAIDSIIYDEHEDPESVQIIVNHTKLDIEIFLRIQNLLSSLQKELDSSWAILGEVFGRFKEKNLGIIIRRIRSNIDDKINFAKKTGFVLEKASFTAADAELLKLFIKPLYGNIPEIAVRELVQNAVDAVRERVIFEPDNINLKSSPSVIVSILKAEDNRWVLKIEDKGIGMSLNTIMYYYLNAGASYRLSSVWKDSFLDEQGKAKVLRSGKFGVGALAAFMLADDPSSVEIKVTTRHIHSLENEAFEFYTKLSDKPIQIKYISKDEPGTIIEVYTSNPPSFMQDSSKEDGSSWDWYCLNQPIVERYSLNGRRLPQQINLPASKESHRNDYHWIRSNDYDSIGWCYSNDLPSVVCNGIVVNRNTNKSYYIEEGSFIGRNLKMHMPAISIFDKDGKLPITLDRLRIEYDQLQFIKNLRDDIARNIVAFLLVSAPVTVDYRAKGYGSPLIKTHPAIKEYLPRIPWLCTNDGAVLYCPELFYFLDIKNIIEISDPSYMSIMQLDMRHAEDVGISLESYSTWDTLKKCSSTKGGNRLVVEGKKISMQQLYRIDEQLKDALIKEKHISKKKLDDFFTLREINLESRYDILDQIRYYIDNRLNDLDKSQSEYFMHLYWKIRDVIEHEKLSEYELKNLLYSLINESLEEIESLLSNVFSHHYQDNRYRHDNEEILYRINREIENIEDNSNQNYGELIYDIREFIRRRNPREFNFKSLKKVLDSIDNMNNTPPTVTIESFGDMESYIDWDELKKVNYINKHHDIPFSELAIDQNFKYLSDDNFLSRIWVEYIGEEVIPYDEKKRENLIKKIQSKVDISQHIIHWENVLRNK